MFINLYSFFQKFKFTLLKVEPQLKMYLLVFCHYQNRHVADQILVLFVYLYLKSHVYLVILL